MNPTGRNAVEIVGRDIAAPEPGRSIGDVDPANADVVSAALVANPVVVEGRSTVVDGQEVLAATEPAPKATASVVVDDTVAASAAAAAPDQSSVAPASDTDANESDPIPQSAPAVPSTPPTTLLPLGTTSEDLSSTESPEAAIAQPSARSRVPGRATGSPVTSSTTTSSSSSTSTTTSSTTTSTSSTTTSTSSTTTSTTSSTTTAAPTTTTTTSTTTTAAPTTTSTTTTTAAPTTTSTTTTTAAPTTTSTTTTAAPSASQGSYGCKSNCKYVGFQNLKGKNGVTLENLVISNPNGRCIDLTNAKNVTIRNVTIQNCGTQSPVNSYYDAGLIHIEDASNITIENSLIDNMSNERFGGSRNNAIQIASSSNITIKNNSIKNIHSNINDNSDDRGSRAIKVELQVSNISISSNRMYNAGRNAVQLSRIQNASGISITYNTMEGRGRWDSDYEDIINLFSASGTSSSPIRIANNTIRNGGPSDSGTGIILGDGNDRTGATRYVVVENNTLIDPGHVGINLAGGDHITVRNNTITGRGNVPLRTTTGFSINDFGYTGNCQHHVVTGNRVWMDNQHLPDGTNHIWDPGTCNSGTNQIHSNKWGDSSLR